jgi:SAM-dependent methyltransferase
MDAKEYLPMFSQEESHWWYVGMRSMVRSLLPPADLPRAPLALDAGCGTGFNLGWLREVYGARAVGLDFSQHALEFCKTRGERELMAADVAALPLREGTFDMVGCFDVLVNVPTATARSRAVADFHRVLKPGGLLLIRVAAFEWLRSSHDEALWTHHRYGSRELRSELENAGFQNVRITFANTLLFPGAVLWRMLKKAGIAPAGSDVGPLSRGNSVVNGLLKGVFALECRLLQASGSLPFGLSLIALARKEPRRAVSHHPSA